MARFILYTFLFIVFIISLGVFGWPYIDKHTRYSFCDDPILYRIDTVNPEFNLTRNEFLGNIEDAAAIWNKAWGKELFLYDPQGELSINMVYDERQYLSSQISELEGKIEDGEQSLEPRIAEFEAKSADFKQKVESLNNDIDYWNKQGGAPPGEYEKLIKRQQELKLEAEQLNAMASSLNRSTKSFNLGVKELNKTIDSFNRALEGRPEEGIFKGDENRIEIYFNISEDELIHTLAHELGHSLGMNHVEDNKAIMFSKTNLQLNPTPDDIAELNEVCKEHSYFEGLESYFNELIYKFETP